MCIAIAKPKDVIIPLSHLEESFKRNDDGAGFAYAEDDQLHIVKGLMTFDSFYEAYKPHKDKAAILHFRITTHGDTNVDNTHPFQVGKNLAVIHNGIIGRVDRSSDLTRSDTYHFNTKYLSQFYKRDSRFAFKEHYADLIKEYIGQSKLVFINNKGHHQIINEKAGTWDEGVWYSNTSFRPYKPPAKVQVPANTPTDNRRRTPSNVFTQGSRVNVTHALKKGVGTIAYFTGGSMVGVLLDGEQQSSLFPMSCIELVKQQKFLVNDWVVRTTDLKKENLGCVTGTSKDKVWVEWLSEYDTNTSVEIVHESALEHCLFS